MKTYRKLGTITAMGIVAAAIATPVGAQQFLKRLAADFDFWGPFEEAFTTLGVDPLDSLNGGIVIYEKSVMVPHPDNTIYITMSTTGDTHGGRASCFTALLDGAFVNAGGQGAARCGTDALGGEVNVPGWLALQKLPEDVPGNNCDDGGGGGGDCHDNNINYQWCAQVKPGPHTVTIRMAAAPTGDNVFIEQAHFYLDSSRITQQNRCVDPTPSATLLESPHAQ